MLSEVRKPNSRALALPCGNSSVSACKWYVNGPPFEYCPSVDRPDQRDDAPDGVVGNRTMVGGYSQLLPV
jgi:hypothetical protein